eukprot:CAMPEP_0173378250 /NCGR_PEP_ID=MMETSP1356-20130122/1439_1 /TAXON_ID=77927 ORGANISM="Hemiselmis virescens, Strain PCC157" /NCGR_SAMPLE_ID=MMETSP1356 /ASSEMBLY_ACC=CAM_ASM_000847 /LENGTH=165 /DNA_ID=CAMNT_0014331253 /DNA_START=345 /DNA_END=842 /DNA_ORIENTATION=+
MVVLPLSVLVYNISNQRRDVYLNITYLIFTWSIAVSTAGGSVFNKAWGIVFDDYAVLNEFTQLGKKYANVANYVALTNFILVTFLSQANYPEFTLNFTSNVSSVSVISVGALVVIMLMENSIAVRTNRSANTRALEIRKLIETVSRTIISAACVLDILALRTVSS